MASEVKDSPAFLHLQCVFLTYDRSGWILKDTSVVRMFPGFRSDNSALHCVVWNMVIQPSPIPGGTEKCSLFLTGQDWTKSSVHYLKRESDMDIEDSLAVSALWWKGDFVYHF